MDVPTELLHSMIEDILFGVKRGNAKAFKILCKILEEAINECHMEDPS
jgi:hypothetical protein